MGVSWLQIDVKHLLEPPVPVRGLLLSPDEQYLGGFRVAYEGFGDTRCHSSCENASYFAMLLISFETGRQAFPTIEVIHSQHAPRPQCRWSRLGRSLSVYFKSNVAASADVDRHFYNIIRFVC